MENLFERYRKVRRFLADTVSDVTTEQFNHIPAGFSNNIIWNLGHVIAAQQGVCYVRAGKELHRDEDIFRDYKPGTRPEKYIDSIGIDRIKSLLIPTIDLFEKDYLANEFNAYTSWTTRYGVELADIKTASEFLFYHEGIHLGYVMALKKCFRK